MDMFLLVSEIGTIICALLAFLYCIAIVWCVEGELDTSYKYFTLAIFSFLVSEILSVYFSRSETLLMIQIVARTFFAVFLLVGILYMRDIVKHIDEKGSRRSKK